MTTRPDGTGPPSEIPAAQDDDRRLTAGRMPEHAPGDEHHRRVRRRQMIAAILAIVAIIIFALIQGFLGAPNKIPGTG